MAPPPLLALGARALTRAPQRRLQTVTTNVPGPQQPLYLCGRRMLEIFPYVSLALDVRIGVAICSYDGTLGFGVTGDGQHATDIPILTGGIEHELAQLLERATPTAPPSTPRAKPHASSNAIAATPPNVGARRHRPPIPKLSNQPLDQLRIADLLALGVLADLPEARLVGEHEPHRPGGIPVHPRRTTRRPRPRRPATSPWRIAGPSSVAIAWPAGCRRLWRPDRRLTAPRRSPTTASATRFGPSDPRYDYLLRSYD